MQRMLTCRSPRLQLTTGHRSPITAPLTAPWPPTLPLPSSSRPTTTPAARTSAGAPAAATTPSWPDEEGPRRRWASRAEKLVFVSGHRLLQPLPLLHEHLRDPLDPRPGPGDRHRPEGRPARPVGLGHHRRRRRPEHRRQPPDPLPSAATWTSTSCCSTTASTA